jgi:hypothetical protein
MLSQAALELARGGWPVFPVDAKKKTPRTKHGHLDASTDPARIKVWAHQFDWGGAIATPTGGGLLVIDIDPRNGGRVPSWAPETLTVTTQSGGLHLHYQVDEDIKTKPGLFGVGVDSKSAGGYVLLPPSPGYEWGNVMPRTSLRAEDLRAKFVEGYDPRTGSTHRLDPEEWYRGIIHDQVLAWTAFFAGQGMDDDDVTVAVWALVDQARKSGTPIDNARNHIGTAIKWVLRREASSALASQAPTLG